MKAIILGSINIKEVVMLSHKCRADSCWRGMVWLVLFFFSYCPSSLCSSIHVLLRTQFFCSFISLDII